MNMKITFLESTKITEKHNTILNHLISNGINASIITAYDLLNNGGKIPDDGIIICSKNMLKHTKNSDNSRIHLWSTLCESSGDYSVVNLLDNIPLDNIHLFIKILINKSSKINCYLSLLKLYIPAIYICEIKGSKIYKFEGIFKNAISKEQFSKTLNMICLSSSLDYKDVFNQINMDVCVINTVEETIKNAKSTLTHETAESYIKNFRKNLQCIVQSNTDILYIEYFINVKNFLLKYKDLPSPIVLNMVGDQRTGKSTIANLLSCKNHPSLGSYVSEFGAIDNTSIRSIDMMQSFNIVFNEYGQLLKSCQSAIKNLCDTRKIHNVREAYGRDKKTLTLFLSFITCSNTPYVLLDNTGSSRHMVVETKKNVNGSPSRELINACVALHNTNSATLLASYDIVYGDTFKYCTIKMQQLKGLKHERRFMVRNEIYNTIKCNLNKSYRDTCCYYSYNSIIDGLKNISRKNPILNNELKSISMFEQALKLLLGNKYLSIPGLKYKHNGQELFFHQTLYKMPLITGCKPLKMFKSHGLYNDILQQDEDAINNSEHEDVEECNMELYNE